MACRIVMDQTLRCLISWIAPILCFTADEAWLAYNQDQSDSIHLHEYVAVQDKWHDQALGMKWADIRKIRSSVTTALEGARNDGLIGGSLSAEVRLTLSSEQAGLLQDIDLASLMITSAASMQIADVNEIQVEVRRADGGKCARCWKQIASIEADSQTEICPRCTDVVAEMKAS